MDRLSDIDQDHELEDQKACLDDIYDQVDPRAYFETLAPTGYAIPQRGAEAALSLGAGGGTVLDVCCSYGMFGALVKTTLQLDDLARHYEHHRRAGSTLDDLVAADRDLLAGHRIADAPEVVGIDVAPRAVEFAVRTGAIDHGLLVDLEDPTSESPDLSNIDMVVTTGGVGYVTERTFGRIADSVPKHASFATYCLRTYDFSDIESRLSSSGRVTQQVGAPVRQRRCMNAQEREWAVRRSRELGHDPTGHEGEGWLYAQLFVSHPESREDVAT